MHRFHYKQENRSMSWTDRGWSIIDECVHYCKEHYIDISAVKYFVNSFYTNIGQSDIFIKDFLKQVC